MLRCPSYYSMLTLPMSERVERPLSTQFESSSPRAESGRLWGHDLIDCPVR